MFELVLKIKDSEIDFNKILKPELEQQTKFRSQVTYVEEENCFKIVIKSPDVNSLRASINSHLLWIKTIKEVGEL